MTNIIIINVLSLLLLLLLFRATYYVFCCRNRNWDSPDLMQFCFFCFLFCFFLFLFLDFVLFCFCCFFVCFIFYFLFLFNNSISSSICKLPIRSEIYNCTDKNTNKVSIIIIIQINYYILILTARC